MIIMGASGLVSQVVGGETVCSLASGVDAHEGASLSAEPAQLSELGVESSLVPCHHGCVQ